MPGLYLYTSNRLEHLVDALAQVLSEPLGSPFSPEIIVVQSRGMERWLRMELARRHGICANVDFPFPNALVKTICSTVLPDSPLDSRYDKSVMVWRIMAVLPDLISRPEFKEVKDYLSQRPGDERLYQLSKHIASCLDQYLIYRPEMILRWEKGRGNHWQAVLWRHIAYESKPVHWPRASKLLRDQIRKGSARGRAVPQRICIFGISSLPPYHIGILGEVAKITTVKFFVLNPSMEYWFDIIPEQKVEKIIREQRGDYHVPEMLHLETGNSLLASMGHLGKDFISLIMAFDPIEYTLFEEPDSDSLLGAIQSDILKLRETSASGSRPLNLPQMDKSISIHSCHSPLREMEVLHDNLLEVIEQEKGVMPKDIVVMAPDISIYAPFINAVFGSRIDGPRGIPYSIADRGIRKFGQLAPALLHLFEFPDSRFPVSQVLSFLERDPVKKRYDLRDADIDAIRKLVSHTRVSWGVDDKMKQDFLLPPTKENTWEFCMERLLLGHALPSDGSTLFKSILPFDDVEGEGAALVGKFASFITTLVRVATSLAEPTTLEAWYWRLMRLSEELFSPDENSAQEYEVLRDIFSRLRSYQGDSGFTGRVSFKVIKNYLEAQLEEAGLSGGFLNKGVTFCSILPMRSIPFKVICLVGMNHSAYPRQSKRLAFDLMAARPRKGDRSRRNDDRFLFLEAILSARKRLIISYVGQNERDNSPIPPSPLVSELVDYLDRNFLIKGETPSKYIIFKHRLHPFSAPYFEPGSNLFTYFDENLAAARMASQTRQKPFTFFNEELPAPNEQIGEISVEELERFLANPVKYILRQRLGIGFRREVPLPKDEEPVLLRGLDDYHVSQSILAAKAETSFTADPYSLLKAQGALPHGNVGKVQYADREREINRFLEELKQITTGEEPRWIEVDLTIRGCRVYGKVGEFYPPGLVHYRYARIRAKDHLRVWLHHLLVHASEIGSAVYSSYIVGKKERWVYHPPDLPLEYLEHIVEIYLLGLRRPIKLFPETSFAYMEKLARSGDPGAAINRAQKIWEGTRYNSGEGDDDHLKLCFGEEIPIDREFKKVADMIVSPILRFREKL